MSMKTNPKFFNQSYTFFTNPNTPQVYLDKFERYIRTSKLDEQSKAEIMGYFEDLVYRKHESWKAAGSFMYAIVTGNFTHAASKADGNNYPQLGSYLRLYDRLSSI